MAAAGSATSALIPAEAAQAATLPGERAFMAGLLQKMAEPVLSNMATGELQKHFALELSPTWDGCTRTTRP